MYEHVKNKFNFKKIKRVEMDIVAYACNPTIEEAEAEGSEGLLNKTEQIRLLVKMPLQPCSSCSPAERTEWLFTSV